MNYGALVWGSAADYHLENITKLQKRAIKIIKFIKAREHVDLIFKNNHILPFKSLRNFCMCKFFWKYKNNLIQIPKKLLDDHRIQVNDHDPLKYVVPFSNTNYSKNSIISSGIKAWNKLPNSIKLKPFITGFSEKCKKYLFDNKVL